MSEMDTLSHSSSLNAKSSQVKRSSQVKSSQEIKLSQVKSSQVGKKYTELFVWILLRAEMLTLVFQLQSECVIPIFGSTEKQKQIIFQNGLF